MSDKPDRARELCCLQSPVPCFPRRVEGAPPALRALLATPGLS